MLCYVLLSSLSRISSHAMAYLILCILTTDHSLLPENSKNLHPPGILTTKRPHHTIHQMARLKEEVTNQSKSKWTRSILGHFGATHLHPVLDHHQYKDCLDDAQRHCYLQQELCYSQRSWRKLKTSSKKERRNKHCFTTKEQKSFLSFNPETQCA